MRSELEELVKRHKGVALSPEMPWYRTEIVVEFASGYMVILTPEGKWLGSWPANRVTATETGTSRLELTLRGERFPFEFEDAPNLLEALAAETDHSWALSASERLVQTLRMLRLRFSTGSGHSNHPDQKRSGASDGERSTPDRVHRALSTSANSHESAASYPIHPELLVAQKETVGALDAAMRWWFGFYFLVEKGSDHTRLHKAGRGLQETSAELWQIRADLDIVFGTDASLDKIVGPYRIAVDGWAYAMDSIARGAILDQKRVADEGFTQMANASTSAERVVHAHMEPAPSSVLSDPLYSLEQLRPPTKVARKAVERAKQPWRRAILAAGSPFRRPE